VRLSCGCAAFSGPLGLWAKKKGDLFSRCLVYGCELWGELYSKRYAWTVFLARTQRSSFVLGPVYEVRLYPVGCVVVGSRSVYNEARSILDNHLPRLLHDTVVRAEHARIR
jgi:hypothetical protein